MPPKNTTAQLHSTIELSCEIVSDLEPHIQWILVDYCPSDDIINASDVLNSTIISKVSKCKGIAGK